MYINEFNEQWAIYTLIYMFIKKRMALETEFWENIQRDSRRQYFGSSCIHAIYSSIMPVIIVYQEKRNFIWLLRKTTGGH